jgi:hypothetical protein
MELSKKLGEKELKASTAFMRLTWLFEKRRSTSESMWSINAWQVNINFYWITAGKCVTMTNGLMQHRIL